MKGKRKSVFDPGPNLVFSSKSNRQIAESALDWASLSNSALRLRCGEMTQQEIKAVRAVLNSVIGK